MKRCILAFLLAACLLSAMQPGLYARAEAYDYSMSIPTDGAALRQQVVTYARELAGVRWVCQQDIDFTKAVTWSPNLYYQAGQTYLGLPYTSDRPSANANLDEFLAACDDSGLYTGPTSWNEMPGSDCGGQVRLAYAWAGVLCNYEMEEMVFDPGANALASGLSPLGGYDWSGFSRSSSTAKSVLAANGEEIMWDCYAQLQAGDCLFVLYANGGEHIMLVTGEPAIVRDGNGAVIPSSSMVPVLELTSGLHSRDNCLSNWNDQPYSFQSLYEIGFIPLTMEAFSQTDVAAPSFRSEGIEIGETVGFHDLMSGRVISNYNIFTLTAQITDASGNTVLTGRSYPNSLRADLSELDYGAGLLSLPAGTYHYVLTAQIGFGQIVMVDTDIDYAGSTGSPVVYISDQGNGNGASEQSPLGNAQGYDTVSLTSYKDSAFCRAMEMLAQTGGTIVICDDVTLRSGRSLQRYTNMLSPLTAPALSSDQTVTLTSSYNGVDYRSKNGAELILHRSAQQAVDLELNIGMVWRELDFRVEYDYAVLPSITESTIGAYVCCDGHKTVIEDTVRVSLSRQGELLDETANRKYFPKLYAGSYNLCIEGTTDLTVMGGRWSTIVGGSHEAYVKGGANVTIGGSAVVYDGVYGGCSSNTGILCGDVSVLINGGTVSGKLIAGGSGTFACDNYSITLTVRDWPDLSGVRIVNAGGSDAAAEIRMDLGEFKNGGENFTAYYNEADFTLIVPAPAPEPRPGADADSLPIVLAVVAAVVLAGAVIAIVAGRKKAVRAHNRKEHGT